MTGHCSYNTVLMATFAWMKYHGRVAERFGVRSRSDYKRKEPGSEAGLKF
jgi:hypothetical protein